MAVCRTVSRVSCVPGFSVAVLQPCVPRHLNPDGTSGSAGDVCMRVHGRLEHSSVGVALRGKHPGRVLRDQRRLLLSLLCLRVGRGRSDLGVPGL